MKNYIAPEMEVSKFNLSDVLTTSGDTVTFAAENEFALPNDNGVTFTN